MSASKFSIRDRTLAMAGICQAAALVKQMGRTGLVDSHDLEVCMYSLYQTDPPTVEAVYGTTVAGLRTGLQELIVQLSRNSRRRDLEIARYIANMLAIGRRLRRQPELLESIGRGIERARLQSTHFSIVHENVLANVASIYSENVSNLSPRIMVGGEPHFLTATENQNTIRALLLAGVRSAILWRQCGGNAWFMLLNHRNVLDEAERLLGEEALPFS